jgi:hypothetical protein
MNAGSSAKKESKMKGEDELDPILDTGVDHLTYVVHRADVEEGNIEPTMSVLIRLLRDKDSVERFRNRVTICFDGYDDDPRELHQIEEVRRFVAALDLEFPFWFYFIDLGDDVLIVLSLILCRYVQDPVRGFIRDPSDWEKFVFEHFVAMDRLFEKFGLDEAESIARTNHVAEYFERVRRRPHIN